MTNAFAVAEDRPPPPRLAAVLRGIGSRLPQRAANRPSPPATAPARAGS